LAERCGAWVLRRYGMYVCVNFRVFEGGEELRKGGNGRKEINGKMV
jgi:hypothetical protein